jgi:4-aminobutyrate aminotransferase-like enzyme
MDLLIKRQRFFPNCLYHSYKKPLVVNYSKDQFYNGNVLDLYNNVCHIGHSNSRVLEAVVESFSNININTRFLNSNLTEYAERLSKYFPLGKKYKMLFVNSGSEANDLALRIILLSQSKEKKIVSLENSYHGTTYLCNNVSHIYSNGFKKPFNELEDDKILFVKPNDINSLDNISFSNIGGLIIESIQGVGGNISLTNDFMQKLFSIAEENNIITICDEVQTGFGRTGNTFWAFEESGVIPDIITCGKPIANGYPMGCVIIREDLAELLGTSYFNTFGGNSVACKVALSVLNELEEKNLIIYCRELGEYFLNELKKIKSISFVTGRGLFIGFKLKKPYKEDEVLEELRMRNILIGIGANNILRIKPPLIITKENIDYFIETLTDIIDEIDNTEYID